MGWISPDDSGWPREGTDWYDANHACEYLSEDSLTIAPTPQNIWRLPTMDEAVRSMSH